MTRLLVCVVGCLGLMLAGGCASTIERRPMAAPVMTRSGDEALFTPGLSEGADFAMQSRRDASLGARADETGLWGGGERADLRGARRVRISTDPATHTYFPSSRRFGPTYEAY